MAEVCVSKHLWQQFFLRPSRDALTSNESMKNKEESKSCENDPIDDVDDNDLPFLGNEYKSSNSNCTSMKVMQVKKDVIQKFYRSYSWMSCVQFLP